ncbi:MAG: FAD binding domain-containing protein, partial [Candidatus Rokuibacteriota bacterium]
MMRLPPFIYLAPARLDEAARMLAEHGADAMAVAGGTDLYPNMKRRQFEPKVLVGLRGIRGLSEIAGDAREGMRIGAGATLTRVAEHPDVATHYPALARAAGVVSTPQLRNMGTLGGNVCVDTRCNYYNQSFEWRKSIGFCMKKDGDICLVAPGSDRCWAVSSSDTAPVLWALGAELTLVGPKGERRIPVRALYQDDGIEYLTKRPDEIVSEVRLPAVDGWRATYWKLRRRGAFDFPVLGVAAAVRLEDGVCRDAKVVLGAVASTPREAPEV